MAYAKPPAAHNSSVVSRLFRMRFTVNVLVVWVCHWSSPSIDCATINRLTSFEIEPVAMKGCLDTLAPMSRSEFIEGYTLPIACASAVSGDCPECVSSPMRMAEDDVNRGPPDFKGRLNGLLLQVFGWKSVMY